MRDTEKEDTPRKPCPFCGGYPEFHAHFKEKDLWNMIHRCLVIGPISWDWGDLERHIKRWNTRAPISHD